MRGGVQKGPGKTELRRYTEKGLTQAQIAEAWESDTGVRISRSTVAMALQRHGLTTQRPRPRYEDMLPWTVHEDHRMHWDARMLRLEGRRRRGMKMSDAEKRKLDHWKQELAHKNAVVTYDGATLEGFFWTPKKDDDDDIIRRPKS